MEKWPYVKQGDVEALVINTLRTATEISGFPGGAPQIKTTLDGYVIGQRWIVVSREGGNVVWPVIEKARIDINVFVAEENARTICHSLAQTALAVLFREMGQLSSPTYGCRISDIQVETGLTRADDYLNDVVRFLFSLRITSVPHS